MLPKNAYSLLKPYNNSHGKSLSEKGLSDFNEICKTYKPTKKQTDIASIEAGHPREFGDGVGKVLLSLHNDEATKCVIANPDAVLAGDCKIYLSTDLPPKGNAAMIELEAIIADLAMKEGGSDHLLNKLVIESHGENGFINIKSKTGQLISLRVANVAEIASKYIEKNGQLILAICFVAPDKPGSYVSMNGETVVADVDLGQKTRISLSKTADEKDIYIKFSGNDFWYVGGKRGNLENYATSDIYCAHPNGLITKDNSKEYKESQIKNEIQDTLKKIISIFI